MGAYSLKRGRLHRLSQCRTQDIASACSLASDWFRRLSMDAAASDCGARCGAAAASAKESWAFLFMIRSLVVSPCEMRKTW